MNEAKLEMTIALVGGLLFIALLLWSITRIHYRVTASHLEVNWLGIPVRRIRLDDIKYISTKRCWWAEKWFNTVRVGHRLLVIHRRTGICRNFMISPPNPFVFKAELYEARKGVMPSLHRSTTLSREDTVRFLKSEPVGKPGPSPSPSGQAGPGN